MKTLSNNQLHALVYFGGITENSFDYYRLAGNERKNIRREFLSMWFDKKLPLAKCGVNAIYNTLADHFEIDDITRARRESNLQDTLRDTVIRNTQF